MKAVKAQHGLAIKINTLSMVGLPDRLVLLPNKQMAFVELKDKGQKPRAIQRKRHQQLRQLGFRVYVIDEATQIASILKEMTIDEV